MRYAMTSGFSAVITLGMPIVLHELLRLPVERAVQIALVAAFVFNFVVMRNFVFRSSGRGRSQFARYVASSVVFRVTEYGLFLLLYDVLAVMYVVALALVLAVSTVSKFLFYRRFVFKAPAL